MRSAEGALARLRILIVEDEYLLADDLCRALRERGAEVIGPVGTLRDACAALSQERIDGAVLDVNLHGEAVYPVADRLTQAGIPFMIATGYGPGSWPERYAKVPRIEKPYDADGLADMLPQALARANGDGPPR